MYYSFPKLFPYRALVLLGLVFFSSWASAALGDFADAVKAQCPEQNALVLKKVAIELRESAGCGERFSRELLESCPAIKCQDLLRIYKINFLTRQGTVVGE